MPAIGIVVEGHGEVQAVPLLARRLALEMGLFAEFRHPIRASRSSLLKAGEIERFARLAKLKAGPGGGVLILIDADDDCPAVAGEALRRRVYAALPNVPVGVVLAKCEFEAWFLASARSLHREGRLSSADDLPLDPEGVRGAKEWLSRRMPNGYSETVDQPALASVMDLKEARACRSFRKLEGDLRRLVEAVSGGSA